MQFNLSVYSFPVIRASFSVRKSMGYKADYVNTELVSCDKRVKSMYITLPRPHS